MLIIPFVHVMFCNSSVMKERQENILIIDNDMFYVVCILYTLI